MLTVIVGTFEHAESSYLGASRFTDPAVSSQFWRRTVAAGNHSAAGQESQENHRAMMTPPMIEMTKHLMWTHMTLMPKRPAAIPRVRRPNPLNLQRPKR